MQNLNDVFSALSDPTRRGIIRRLADRETPLAALAEPTNMTQTAVTKHVRVLEKAGLVVVEKRGRTRHCSLAEASGLKSAFEWLADYQKFWEDGLTSLVAHLDTLPDERHVD